MTKSLPGRALRAGIAVALGALGLAAATDASATNLEECTQAAEFIGNAARARDAGMAREDFLAKMRSDLEIVHQFPPKLRWFVETDADEQFLLKAAEDVFDHPQPPERHARQFAEVCASRVDV
jgi:hypothetical protein